MSTPGVPHLAARRCARRRLVLLAGMVALACGTSSVLAVAGQTAGVAGTQVWPGPAVWPGSSGRGAVEALLLHLAVSTALAVSLVAVRHVLLAAGRASWATALPAAAACLPPVATAGSVAARAVEGGLDPRDVLWVAGMPGWAGLAAVAASAWLRPAGPRSSRTPWAVSAVAALLAGWGATAALQTLHGPGTGSPWGAGWPALLTGAPPPGSGGGDAAVALALMATAALAVTARLPALTRWRLALAPAACVTVLVAVPDLLAATLSRTWAPLPAGLQAWQLALPSALCLVGAAAGMLLACARGGWDVPRPIAGGSLQRILEQ